MAIEYDTAGMLATEEMRTAKTAVCCPLAEQRGWADEGDDKNRQWVVKP
jgi:hypothetical protein